MLKYVNTDIVFQEIPDETTLAINLANCPCRCPGCHSAYLWKDVGTPLTPEALDAFVSEYGSSITCISLMGGDAEPASVNTVARYMKERHPQYKVGWYTGRVRIDSAIDKSLFDYIKVGPYIRHLGALKSPTTNQRMYKRLPDGQFADITSRFWRK